MAQIEIKNLTFKYAMADSSCLKNVSLNIEMVILLLYVENQAVERRHCLDV